MKLISHNSNEFVIPNALWVVNRYCLCSELYRDSGPSETQLVVGRGQRGDNLGGSRQAKTHEGLIKACWLRHPSRKADQKHLG